MSLKYIWIKNKRYYYYDTFTDWKEAHKTAMYHRKKNKCRYFIMKYEHGTLFPEIRYRLYLDKVFRLF